MQLTTSISFRPGARPDARIPEAEPHAPQICGGIAWLCRAAHNFRKYKLPALLLIGSVAVLLVATRNSLAAEPNSLEYKVKAAFLYNFARFVEWPAEKFPQPASPIIIGVVGEDPFGNILDETVKGKTINGRAVVVRRFAPGDDLSECHLLFISRSLQDSLDSILARLKSKSVLTVGETGQFAHRGGMIDLLIVDDCVKCEINLDTTEQAGLKVSSKLSSVARVIKSETPNHD